MSTPAPALSQVATGKVGQDRPAVGLSWKTALAICLLLAGATAAVYWPVGQFQFIHCDDPDYVSRNWHVQEGLTWAGAVWAFTSYDAGNWHPVTWLSHMLDCQLFGMNAGAHHVVNVLFHTANTLLLFLLLQRLTGATWRSAFVAALFGVHPLHVESVAWISERKDVLSMFFFLLTIWSYAAYAARKDKSVEHGESDASESPSPQPSPQGRGSPELPTPRSALRIPHFWYALSLFLFAVGLMSKPMLVTTPFVLLLLDYWPLRRFGVGSQKECVKTALRLVVEKAPFFALSVISSILTFFAQRQVNAVMPISLMPLGSRVENALAAYARYLDKMIWPTNLAIFYPYKEVPFELLAMALVLLLGVSLMAWATRKNHAYLIVGWLWFLGTLVPVIGLVQVGSQALADRYTYIPLIGIFIAIVWGAEKLLRAAPGSRAIAGGLAVALIAVSQVLAAGQVRFWKNSDVLFRHAIAVTTDNALAQLNLGTALAQEGKLDEAEEHYREALRISPSYAAAQSNVGFILATKGKWAEAISLYREALASCPQVSETHFLLGSALVAQGHPEQAIPEYETALQLNPNGEITLNDLAWLLATAAEARLRDGTRAVALAERVCRLTNYKVPQYIGSLAAAYAEAGRFADAVNTAERAEKLAAAAGDKQLAARNEQLLEFYRQGKPFHEGERPKQ